MHSGPELDLAISNLIAHIAYLPLEGIPLLVSKPTVIQFLENLISDTKRADHCERAMWAVGRLSASELGIQTIQSSSKLNDGWMHLLNQHSWRAVTSLKYLAKSGDSAFEFTQQNNMMSAMLTLMEEFNTPKLKAATAEVFEIWAQSSPLARNQIVQDVRVLPLLKNMLHDKDLDVRVNAAAAIATSFGISEVELDVSLESLLKESQTSSGLKGLRLLVSRFHQVSFVSSSAFIETLSCSLKKYEECMVLMSALNLLQTLIEHGLVSDGALWKSIIESVRKIPDGIVPKMMVSRITMS